MTIGDETICCVRPISSLSLHAFDVMITDSLRPPRLPLGSEISSALHRRSTGRGEPHKPCSSFTQWAA